MKNLSIITYFKAIDSLFGLFEKKQFEQSSMTFIFISDLIWMICLSELAKMPGDRFFVFKEVNYFMMKLNYFFS